jgi:hypothetical protein
VRTALHWSLNPSWSCQSGRTASPRFRLSLALVRLRHCGLGCSWWARQYIHDTWAHHACMTHTKQKQNAQPETTIVAVVYHTLRTITIGPLLLFSSFVRLHAKQLSTLHMVSCKAAVNAAHGVVRIDIQACKHNLLLLLLPCLQASPPRWRRRSRVLTCSSSATAAVQDEVAVTARMCCRR